MKKKKLIRIAAVCMAVFLQAGLWLYAPQQSVAAATAAPQLPDLQLQVYQVDRFDQNAVIRLHGAQTGSYDLSASEWADDGSDYYFSLLTTEEKGLYLRLKQAADACMTGTEDFETTTVKRSGREATIYILPRVSYGALTLDQMKRVVNCFIFENPQYYFLRTAIVYSEGTRVMTIGLYSQFAKGSVRADYTEAFLGQLEAWEAGFAGAGTTVELETQIHQCVCDNVSYNEDLDVVDADDVQLSQSCISGVLFDRSTVCTGYAKLFSLLCNRAGITCVTVTSNGHAWNKVRMGGVWYNVDCTWDDDRGDGKYLNVTDAQLRREDTDAGEHLQEAHWNGYAPACTVVFDAQMANGADSGANVAAPAKMAGITALSQEQKKISISFEPKEGCDGYTIQYASDVSMNASKKKNIQKTSCSIIGLTSGKTYYVRVRAYALDSNGAKVYGEYSKKLRVVVK